MELDNKIIGNHIRKERKAANLSQAALAELAGISVPYVSHIETGRKGASLDIIVRIADALQVSVERLLPERHPSFQSECDMELFRLISSSTYQEKRLMLTIFKAMRSYINGAE